MTDARRRFLAFAGTWAVIAAAMLWRRGDRRGLIYLLAFTLWGRVMVDAVKLTLGRARPDDLPQLAETISASFPSGHSANSTIVARAAPAGSLRMCSATRCRAPVNSGSRARTRASTLSRAPNSADTPAAAAANGTDGPDGTAGPDGAAGRPGVGGRRAAG